MGLPDPFSVYAFVSPQDQRISRGHIELLEAGYLIQRFPVCPTVCEHALKTAVASDVLNLTKINLAVTVCSMVGHLCPFRLFKRSAIHRHFQWVTFCVPSSLYIDCEPPGFVLRTR